MSEIQTVQLPVHHLVGIRRSVDVRAMGAYFHEVLPRVARWVEEQGLTAVSAPCAVWHGMDPETGVCDAQAGMFIREEADGEGEISTATTPAGAALKLVHVGSYDQMPASWRRLYAHASSEGLTPGLGWEVYVDDPGVVDAASLKTEIYLSIA